MRGKVGQTEVFLNQCSSTVISCFQWSPFIRPYYTSQHFRHCSSRISSHQMPLMTASPVKSLNFIRMVTVIVHCKHQALTPHKDYYCYNY